MVGCGNLKPPSKPDEFWVPPKWEKTTKEPDEAWMSLRAKSMDSSEPLDLEDVVNIALRNNPLILQAFYNSKAAHAQLKQAESTWYPQVSVSGDYTLDKKDANQPSDDMDTRSYGGIANASMLAFDFGGRAAAVREAYDNLIAANFTFNQTVQDTIRDAQSAYFALYTAKANIEAQESNVHDSKESLYVTEEKYKAGIVVKLDLLQAQANYEQALFTLEDAKGKNKTAKGELTVILGFPADTEFEIADPSAEVPKGITEKDIRSLIDEGLERRPDIGSSKATFRSQKAAIITASSELWPTLDVGGSAGKSWIQNLDDDKSYRNAAEYTGFLQVNWDVFDGFNNYAGRLEAIAEKQAGYTQLLQDELAASADIWSKYYDLKTAISKIKFSKAFLKSSAESFHLALESYSAGLKDILDLLLSQTQLAQARSDLVESEDDMYTAYVELLHATGSLTIESESE